MFGGGAKKKQPTKPRPAGTSLSSFGLIDVPGTDEFGNISLEQPDDDEDLEAELHAIAYGNSKTKKPIKKKQLVSDNELQNMVDLCMQDIPSGEEYEEEGFDDNDAELMSELNDIASEDEGTEQDLVANEPSQQITEKPTMDHDSCNAGFECAGAGMLGTIESRINMYSVAQTKASQAGESSKARRFGRALTTLNELKRNIKSGKSIREEDIPPPLASSSTSPIKSNVAPNDADTRSQIIQESTASIPGAIFPTTQDNKLETPENTSTLSFPLDKATKNESNMVSQDYDLKSSNEIENIKDEEIRTIPNPTHIESQIISDMKLHREKYKKFALQSKSQGDKENAIWGLKAVKLCDMVLKKLEKGDSVDFDLSSLPELPTSEKNGNKSDATSEKEIPPKLQRTFSRDDPIQIPDNPEDIPPPDRTVPLPKTIEEALNQRLYRYRDDESKAKSEGNASRARRLGRICKQYEDALKLHKRGKPIPVAELPTPPGFPPIPASDLNATASSPANQNSDIQPNSVKSFDPTSSHKTSITTENTPKPKPAVPKQKSLSVQEKQLALLEKRQALFKAAALEAKRAGQIEQAKEYLRSSKGFDKLIDASKGGLPVDITTLPVPPQAIKQVDMGFTLVSREDGMHISEDLDNKSRQEMYLKLESDIKTQIKMCDANQKHFRITGDVGSANKFQQMAEHTKKDLDALRFAFKRGDPVPKFHYEVRAFSIIVCNTDLTDHEMELTIEHGINYNVSNPKEVDTYCRIEFPYPKETPFKDKTSVIKDTNNPEYKHKIMIPVNIKEKACQRVFKRGAAKIEVWSKGGFLRGDTLLGTATVKLSPLETSCTLHDTFPLMEGRRAVGGKVEVIIKLRNAVVSKQVEKKEEKWLVISFK